MWEKVSALLLSSLLPASIYAAQISSTAPTVDEASASLDIQVQPLVMAKEADLPVPQLSARSALIIEANSNTSLYEKDAWEVVPIASLTKLMTALLVREQIQDVDTVVTVSSVVNRVDGSTMGLRAGEQITVQNLLKGLLMESGNDAAFALSEVVAGSPEAFVELMNERKHALGLRQTTFVDPAGIDLKNQASAVDVARLAKQVFKDPLLRSIMGQKEEVVQSADGGISHKLQSTNQLLGTEIGHRIIAGKTGTLPGWKNLVAFTSSEKGFVTLIVLLGSPYRFGEIAELIGYSDQKYGLQ